MNKIASDYWKAYEKIVPKKNIYNQRQKLLQ